MGRTKALPSAPPKLPAYLTEWLICLKSALKPTRSLYFCSDSTASHCFRNEIVWKRTISDQKARNGRTNNISTILFHAAKIPSIDESGNQSEVQPNCRKYQIQSGVLHCAHNVWRTVQIYTTSGAVIAILIPPTGD